MHEQTGARFAELTSLRLGGPARRLLSVDDGADLLAVLHDLGTGDALILGEGSNLVVSDDGVDVPVVHVCTSGSSVSRNGNAVDVTVAAGESWDGLVARSVAEGWTGLEALSGIPGRVGATPMQNVGAYGQEVSDTISSVEVFDRLTGTRQVKSNSDCAFGYRTSVFKHEPNRFVVLTVEFRLRRTAESQPVTYQELARRLEVEPGATAPLAEVRDAVLALRRSKGMVLDPDDHDTWSAGSFFTNPILLQADVLPEDAPRWPQPDGRIKTSAAWLIERAGFTKGFGADIGDGRVLLSTKHTLALTNRGGATTADLLELARVVRDGVRATFGIELEPEPTLVGVAL